MLTAVAPVLRPALHDPAACGQRRQRPGAEPAEAREGQKRKRLVPIRRHSRLMSLPLCLSG